MSKRLSLDEALKRIRGPSFRWSASPKIGTTSSAFGSRCSTPRATR